MWSKPSLSTSLLHRNNLDCHDTPDTRSAHPFRFSRTACPPTHLAAGRCFLVRGFQIKRHRLSSSHMCSFRCNNCTGGAGRSPLLKNDDRLPSDQIHGGLNKQRTWRKDYFFFFFAWRFILPLSSLRGLTSIDGCPSVNKTHGSNQMTVEHRSTRHERAGRLSRCEPDVYVFTHFWTGIGVFFWVSEEYPLCVMRLLL